FVSEPIPYAMHLSSARPTSRAQNNTRGTRMLQYFLRASVVKSSGLAVLRTRNFEPTLPLHKKRNHVEPGTLRTHRLLGGRRNKTACRVEDLRHQIDIPGAGHKNPGPRERPMHSGINIALILKRFVPCSARPFTPPPGPARDRFNRHDRNIPFGAKLSDSIKRGSIMRILHHDVTVREQYRIEVETLEAAQVRRRDLGAVTGYTNKADQTLFARFYTGVQRALRAQRGVPFYRVGKTMKLDEIDALHAYSFKGRMNLAFGLVVAPQMGLSRNEKAPWVFSKPRGDPQLGIPIPGCNVKVVDTVPEQDLDRLIRFILCDLRQRCPAKNRPGALVTSPSKELLGNHHLFHRQRSVDWQALNS